VPILGFIDHDTYWKLVPVTVGVNVAFWPAWRFTVAGLTDTEMTGGLSVVGRMELETGVGAGGAGGV
jgi:hypothetical protein